MPPYIDVIANLFSANVMRKNASSKSGMTPGTKSGKTAGTKSNF